MIAPHTLPRQSADSAPAAALPAFGSPRALVRNPALTDAQKRELLYQWAYDAAELDVATEEGMPGAAGAPDDLQREVQLALRTLHVDLDPEHSGPTKHHGFPG